MEKTTILGVDITAEKFQKILDSVVSSLNTSKKPYYIVTPNPEILVYAQNHSEFKSILNKAEIALPDGLGILLASKILGGKKISARVTGTDFMEKLCEAVSKTDKTVSLIGGKSGIAQKTSECLQKKYPGLKIGFAQEEWSQDLEKIPTDILFVAFGFPKQEEWMHEHLNNAHFKVAMGVGGAFDYISGQVPRAPKSVRSLGLEWLFRLIIQPWRIKRQLALLQFMYLIIKNKA